MAINKEQFLLGILLGILLIIGLELQLLGQQLALLRLENENYKQVVEDIQECLKKQGQFPKDAS